MASMPPGPPGPPPGGPAPGGGGAGFAGGAPKPPQPGGGAPPGTGGGGDPSQNAIVGVVKIAQQMEQMLQQFAQAMPEGAQDFKACADSLKQGIAKSMAAAAQQGGGGGGQGGPGGGGAAAPTVSPTETGVGYAGGSMGSGGRP